MFDDLKAIFLSTPALAFIGLVIGSFLNVVIHRLPIMIQRDALEDGVQALGDKDAWAIVGASATDAERARSVAGPLEERLGQLAQLDLDRPSSHCPACGHRIRWFENVPVVSWLMLRARCSNCGVRIAARYVLVELATAALFAGLAWRGGPELATLAWGGFAAVVLAASIIDWETALLPDVLTLPLLWAGLLASVVGLTVTSGAAVVGAVAGYLVPWALSAAMERLTGNAAMAAGDFKLLAAVGAWMGWQVGLAVLVLSLVLGALVVAVRLGVKKSRGQYVPFGPYIGTVTLAFVMIGPAAVGGWL